MSHLGHREGAFWFYWGLIVLGVVTLITYRRDPVAVDAGGVVIAVGAGALLVPPCYRLVRDLRRAHAEVRQRNSVQALSVPAIPITTTIEDTSGRIIVSVTPQWLMAQFTNRTDVQTQTLLSPYIGKWMRVSGNLGDVKKIKIFDDKSFAQVTFRDVKYGSDYVFLQFSEPGFIDRLSVMQLGEAITVLGQIQSVNPLFVSLEECELL
jgi:hypothetical protein